MYEELIKLLPALSNSELRGLANEIAGMLNDRLGTTEYRFMQPGQPGVVALPGPGLQASTPKPFHYGNRPKPPFWCKVPTGISKKDQHKGAFCIQGSWAKDSTPEGSLAVVGESGGNDPANKKFYLLRRKRGAITRCFGKYDVEGFEMVMRSDGASRDMSAYPELSKLDGKPIAPIVRALIETGIPITA